MPPGVYTVTLSGGSLSTPLSAGNVFVGTDNVKRDFLVPTVPTVPDPDSDLDPDPEPPTVVLPPADLAAPLAKLSAKNVIRAGKAYGFSVIYTDDRAINLASIGKGDVLVYRNARFKPVAQLLKRVASADGRTVTAFYRIMPPGGSWDAADQGRYRVKLLPGQVLDSAGNPAAAGTLGTFTVNLANKAKKPVKARTARAVLASVPRPAHQPAVRPAFSTERILDASPRGSNSAVNLTPGVLLRESTCVYSPGFLASAGPQERPLPHSGDSPAEWESSDVAGCLARFEAP